MNHDSSSENNETVNRDEIQAYLKNSCGVEVITNDLSSVELVNQGYRMLSIEELDRLSPIMQFAPQLVIDKVNRMAAEQAFKRAIENSFKCILDPSMHLAKAKEASNQFLGSGLDNASNQVKGQARWLKNNEILRISNAPQIALNAFNALSLVTGQYFMSQINATLSAMREGVDDIRTYLETVQESKLKSSFEEFDEIVKHLYFIRKDPERTKLTVGRLASIQLVARNSINICNKQIKNIINKHSSSDDKKKIIEKIKSVRNHIMQYRCAVYLFNYAKTVNIYLYSTTDVEELMMYRNEISSTANRYIGVLDRTITWEKEYLNGNQTLNNASKIQIVSSLSAGVAAAILGNGSPGSISVAARTALEVSSQFDEKRKENKTALVNSYNSYSQKMRNTGMIDSSVAAIDKYIDSTSKKMEIISVDGQYFIKNIDTENK